MQRSSTLSFFTLKFGRFIANKKIREYVMRLKIKKKTQLTALFRESKCHKEIGTAGRGLSLSFSIKFLRLTNAHPKNSILPSANLFFSSADKLFPFKINSTKNRKLSILSRRFGNEYIRFRSWLNIYIQPFPFLHFSPRAAYESIIGPRSFLLLFPSFATGMSVGIAADPPSSPAAPAIYLFIYLRAPDEGNGFTLFPSVAFSTSASTSRSLFLSSLGHDIDRTVDAKDSKRRKGKSLARERMEVTRRVFSENKPSPTGHCLNYRLNIPFQRRILPEKFSLVCVSRTGSRDPLVRQNPTTEIPWYRGRKSNETRKINDGGKGAITVIRHRVL
ncbi:hypothetical protein PUN28_005801 [Cardiocondyla obscurior]|uniref:Uncharacterized protein n=1 Tax=Cardiocondyla obscurior TaxID=286306 RepID=A0AAW2GAL2_9HYME